MTRTLLFDCDGVLADTERDGHLVAFNRMWREEGVNWQWNLIQYADKVKIGGGKEREANARIVVHEAPEERSRHEPRQQQADRRERGA